MYVNSGQRRQSAAGGASMGDGGMPGRATGAAAGNTSITNEAGLAGAR